MEIKSDEEVDDESNPSQESEVNDKVQKCKVVHVPLGSIPHDDTPPRGAQPPRYNRERDEPAFEAAWKHVAELRAQGKVKTAPPFPQGGIKLRGPRHRRLIDAEQIGIQENPGEQ